MQQRLGERRREAVDLLDLAAHAVVAERDLALQATVVGQVDVGRVVAVGVELADVVQERAGDGDVAVDAREGGRGRAHRLPHGQRVLEQPVPVGLVVELRRRSVPVGRPAGGARADQAVEQRAQRGLLDRRDQLAQVRLHLLGPAQRAVEQLARVVAAGLGRAQGAQVDLGAVARMEHVAADDVDRLARAHERRARR